MQSARAVALPGAGPLSGTGRIGVPPKGSSFAIASNFSSESRSCRSLRSRNKKDTAARGNPDDHTDSDAHDKGAQLTFFASRRYGGIRNVPEASGLANDLIGVGALGNDTAGDTVRVPSARRVEARVTFRAIFQSPFSRSGPTPVARLGKGPVGNRGWSDRISQSPGALPKC